MYYEEDERDPFEAFGDVDSAADAASDLDFDPDFDAELERAALAAGPEHKAGRFDQYAPEHAPAPVKTGFSWAGFLGGIASLIWIGGAIGGPLTYYGLDSVMSMDPAMQGGFIALAFGPALLFWVAASAAGEALKARKLAAELTIIARDVRAPFEAGQADAQRMGASVRGELEALTDAVANALDRMAELELSAKRNTAMFGETIEASHVSAAALTHAIKRERDALAEISTDLRGQTETVAHSIGRQVRLMREASKLVTSEMRAAEDALQAHLASFAASASMIGERTSAFHHAADEASAAAASLNGTMAVMLDGLSEATKLSESARKSSEQAVMAANETAGALRETTRSAVFEAKRAAQLIRAETQAMQESAAETLAKLKDAASAAQAASQNGRAAANRHAAPKVKATEPVNVRSNEREEMSDLRAAANAAIARTRAPTRTTEEERRSAFKGFGSWGNFMPRSQAEEAPPAANEDFDLVDFDSKRDPDVALKCEALDLVADAGVDLEDVLAASDLARIARFSRDGAASRRRAVSDAAPGAVTRIARYVGRNEKAHLVANEFRTRPDLAKSEDKAEGSDLVRAYLLIDAALA